MKVFIIVRNTQDDDYADVDVFQSVHLTEESADIGLAKLEDDFPAETFEILERDCV